MAHQRDGQREPSKHVRTTSTSTSVECVSPGAISRRRVSWSRSRADIPILRPDPTPYSVRNANRYLGPAVSQEIPYRGSLNQQQEELDHRLSDVSLGPNLSFYDIFGHDRTESRVSGLSQPVASSSRVHLVSTENARQPGKDSFGRKGSLDEQNPENGLTDPSYGDDIPMKKVGRASSSDEEESYERVDELSYASAGKSDRRRTHKPYEKGANRHESILRVVDSVVRRSSTLRSAAGLLQRVSRRVAPVRPNDSDDESLRPLRFADNLDVDPNSPDRLFEDPSSDSEAAVSGSQSRPLSPDRTPARAGRADGLIRTPSAGLSMQTLPSSNPPGVKSELPLKGKSLGVFGPKNKLRVALYQALRRPYTEFIILLLIIFHAAVLISQSAPRIHGPRDTSGYFYTWEDSGLLVIFILYTFEALARMIVTGFVFDQQITLTAVPGIIEPRKVSQPKVLLERLLSGRRNAHQPHGAGDYRVRRALSAIRPSAVVKQQFRAQQQWRSENIEREQETLRSLGNGRPGPSKPATKAKLFDELPFEAALKRQVGMVVSGRPYLRHSWHRIDLLSIICFWIAFSLAYTGKEATDDRHLFIFRGIATIRTARLLLITQGTATVLHSLKVAGKLLLQVSFFIGFVALLLAIAGVQSFSGSFNRSCQMYDSHSNSIIDLSKQCGGHIDSNTLAPVAWALTSGDNRYEPKGYICPIGQVCRVVNGNPENLGTFDNVFQALLQITIIASANKWSPIMYQQMDSDYYSSGIFVLVALILLNFWLVSLLIAAVVKAFQSIRSANGKSGFGGHSKTSQVKPQASGPSERTKWIKWFNRSEPFWLLLIFGSILVQAQKDTTQSRKVITVLDNVERGITIMLDLEIIFRVLAYGRRWSCFFESGRNSFDAFLAAVTTVLIVPYIQETSVYPWLTIFLLMRWYRIILAIPPLRPLIGNVFRHFAEITNTVLFLLLMTGSASLVGAQMLRGDIDPESTQLPFDTILSSFYAMYQIMLLEDWVTVLGDAITAGRDYKQTVVLCILIIGWALLSSNIILQLLVAVINEAFDLSEQEKIELQKQRVANRKNQPLVLHQTWFERWNPYRLQAPQPRRTSNSDNVNFDTVFEGPTTLREDWSKFVKFTTKLLRFPNTGRVGDPSVSGASRSKQDAGLKRLLRQDPDLSVDIAEESLKVRRKIQAEFILDHPGYDVSLFIFPQGSGIRTFCQACVPCLYERRLFGRQPGRQRYILQAIVFAAIIVSIAVSAITTPAYRQQYYSENGLVRSSWFMITQGIIGLVFLVEVCLKAIADGWFFTPNGYLRSFWNVFDFLIITSFLAVFIQELIVFAGMGRAARALTALRALRLISSSRHMRDAFRKVLYGSALGLLAASTIMGLYLVPFAIWGRNLFSGRLYSCNDSTASGKADCYGEFISMPVDESLAFLAPRIWTNPNPAGSEWSFDDFRSSLLILFESVSLEGWTDVLASLMNINSGKDLQPRLNNQPLNGLFLVLFILFGSILIGSSFISILITAYSRNNGTAYLTQAQEDYRALRNFLEMQTPTVRPGRRTGFRAWCLERAIKKHGWWARCTTAIYTAHMLLLLLQDNRDRIISSEVSNWLFFLIGSLLLMDVLVRLYGLGLPVFFKSRASIFDAIVLVGMQATTIPLIVKNNSPWEVSWANFQLQKLFLSLLCLKLIQRNDGLSLLFRTSIASLAAIGKILCLWAILFATFALAYVQAFGNTKLGNNATSRYSNHRSWGNSLLSLATASTGEAWNANMHDYMVEYPRCVDNDSYLISDCGHETWALGLFSSWNLISMYLMLNVFIAVVVESFGVVWGSKRVTRAVMREVKEIWARLDPHSTGFIERALIPTFLQALPKPFDIGSHNSDHQLHHLLEAAKPDARSPPDARVIAGAKTVIDIGKLQTALADLDVAETRSRRAIWSQVLHEANMSAVDPRGLAFTDGLLILARRKIIKMADAFDLDELSARAKVELEIQDMLNLDRVRSLLRKVYCQRRYQEMLVESRLRSNSPRPDIPSIVINKNTPYAHHHGPSSSPPLTPVAPTSPSIWKHVASSAASADGQVSPAVETFDSLARGRRPSLQSQNDVHDIPHVRHHSDIGMQPSHMYVDPFKQRKRDLLDDPNDSDDPGHETL